MSKFIYFPSFSAGEYGDKLKKDFRFRNGMTCRFYSDEMEEKYRHPQVLITAGAHFKTDGYRDKLGLTKDNLVMGDQYLSFLCEGETILWCSINTPNDDDLPAP